ncbi:MAG: hypothetical protein M3362_15025 [Acidobacteriota bacterium]|nr:hypothetical protein [Acidobacteriota bacterium]
MSDSSEYEAVRFLAQALSERDHENHERAIELLKTVILICEGSDTGTCLYLNRAAHHALHGIYQKLGRADEASQYYRKAMKLGVTKEELEKV